MESTQRWNLVESDPAVFTEMLQRLGATNLRVAEVYSLDAQELEAQQPVFGLIFLFQWGRSPQPAGQPGSGGREAGLFYAKQVVQDACASQALLSVLLNLEPTHQASIGAALEAFRGATADFPPELKGEAIGEFELLRRVHNSFAPARAAPSERAPDGADGEAFHFVAFVPGERGAAWELDGLAGGPILHPGGGWIEAALGSIARRAECSAGSLKFSLMAVVLDRRAQYREALREIRARPAASAEELAEAARLELQLAHEEAMHREHAADNEVRRADFGAFIMQVLRIASEAPASGTQ